MTTVVSIKNLYSQITKECSHIISLFHRVKNGAEGVNLADKNKFTEFLLIDIKTSRLLHFEA